MIGYAIKVWFLAAAVGLGGIANAAEATFDRIIAFGDSYTDNAFDDGHGFNRYANGRVWVEYLADSLAIPDLQDRAWGGAMTGDGNANGFDWSGLNWQVDQFEPPKDLSRTLFTVWIGINDLYDGNGDVPGAIENVSRALDKLISSGARHILVLSLPDETLAPAYREGSDYAAVAGKVREQIRQFNQTLSELLTDPAEGLRAKNPEITVNFVDTYDLFNQMATDGRFKNIAEPWFGTYEYPHADGYMWWDDWHPMTEVHRIVADHVATELVP